MKQRDYEIERRGWEATHAAMMRKATAVSAKRLCSYLSDDTFDAVCRDLMRGADAGAGDMLKLMQVLKQERQDRTAMAVQHD